MSARWSNDNKEKEDIPTSVESNSRRECIEGTVLRSIVKIEMRLLFLSRPRYSPIVLKRKNRKKGEITISK